MLLGEIIQVALQAIRANKLRSLLTMLGIIIGVGAVITMVALGSGAQKSVQDRIEAMGPTLLTLFPGQSFRGGIAFNQRVSLTMDDDTALVNNRRYVSEVVPELSSNMQVQYVNQNINTTVLGTTSNYADVHKYTVTAGRMFTTGEDEARRRYAVLGGSVPDMFQANPAAMIGQEIQIRGIPFEIIGVLSQKGSQGFNNPDEQILIPLQTARFRVLGTNRLRTIVVQARDVQSMTLGMIEIERVLRRQHKIRPGMDNDFQIRNQSDILSTSSWSRPWCSASRAAPSASSWARRGPWYCRRWRTGIPRSRSSRSCSPSSSARSSDCSSASGRPAAPRASTRSWRCGTSSAPIRRVRQIQDRGGGARRPLPLVSSRLS